MPTPGTYPKPPMTLDGTVNQAARHFPVKLIVLHHTASENINGVLAWFRNPKSERSAHFVVGKDGTIVQLVPPDRVAWHCRGQNQESVGIEVVSNNHPLTEAQNEALKALVGWLLELYNLDYAAVSGHRYVGLTKTECPGKLFDKWGNVHGWARTIFKGKDPLHA